MRFKEPFTTLEDLLKILPPYYSQADRDLIQRAYQTAAQAHAGQKRASGEPYVTHCVAVASILVEEFRVPADVVAAALLHDTVEDTDITLDDIRRDFGDHVAQMVDGVTKMKHLPRVSHTLAATESLADDQTRAILRKRALDNETLRKIIMTLNEDPSVVLIKLADRLHNMRTLQHMPPHKQRRIASQTMEVFAPLANRLGLWQIKWQLEDLSFRYLEPEKYKDIASRLEANRERREREIQEIIITVKKLLDKHKITADITGRPKHIYSIYRKMQRKGATFDMVHDVRAVRIIVQAPEEERENAQADKEDLDRKACYTVLGILHGRWRPIPGEFDDYIANPKDNDYRSLHTAVLYDDNKPLEFQIRTPSMHEQAEYGIAAHWRYKEEVRGERDKHISERLARIRKMLEWSQEVDDPDDFVDNMKKDIFASRIYVMSPKGDVYDLPVGATPIDFAYYVHTEVGHRCRGARINGQVKPLNTPLKNGDVVEILTIRKGGPSRDWITPGFDMVKTPRARAKIRQWFKRQRREANINQGRRLLETEFHRLGLEVKEMLPELTQAFNFPKEESFLAALGTGEISIAKVVNYLSEKFAQDNPLELPTKAIEVVQGNFQLTGLPEGVSGDMARCCNPLPGDPIVGLITRGRGVRVHRQDCNNILRVTERERLLKLDWSPARKTYPVPIVVSAYDRPKLMQDIISVISNEDINIANVNITTKKYLTNIHLTLEVTNLEQLGRVLGRIAAIPNVRDACRIKNQ